MWEGMTEIRVYLNETAARTDAARLEACGLQPVVTTDNCGGMRPHLDLQAGVHLLVPSAQAEEAREFLAAETEDDGAWTCSACDAAGEPGYDACWRCGTPRA